MAVARTDALQAGRDAFSAGKTLDDCPYTNPDLAAAWRVHFPRLTKTERGWQFHAGQGLIRGCSTGIHHQRMDALHPRIVRMPGIQMDAEVIAVG
jgi:hypothetical protein